MRLQTRALEALATLERCPCLPADVLACLLGLRSRAAAYQLLARLARPRPTELPLLVSTYRLLAALVAEQAVAEPVRVLAWEHRWRRTWRPVGAAGGRPVAVELPGAADLAPCSGRPGWSVLLLSDLGTAPVGHYRAQVRRLLGLRGAAGDPRTAEPVLAIATPDPDGRGGRAAAWLRLLAEVAAQQQEPPLRSRVLTWEQVAQLGWSGPAAGRPATSSQQLLDLVGRHPCLSLGQLAELLGTSRRRAARLRDDLVTRGWLRLIPVADIPPVALARLEDQRAALGLTELTPLGRRVLAGRLALGSAAAARHHGLSGGQDWAGHRRRLLRTLAHTLGVNDVFVALAAAARRAAARGQDEALEEWRSAAACERRLCKPDGYGRYRRGQATLSFFLEYDRATERAASYAAKFDAYYRYRYRASRQATREYAGFPTVLVVTTSQTAEHRIVEAAARAWARHGGPPLAVFVTRTELLASQSDGLLGPIWRAPCEHGLGSARTRLFALAAPASDATMAWGRSRW